MENNRNMLKQKLGVSGILKESLKIPYQNPKFVLLTFLSSLPLVFLMVIHEMVLQKTLIETKALATRYRYSMKFYLYSSEVLDNTITLFQDMSPIILQMTLLYFVPLHLFDLINTITTVNSASTIYAKEKSVNIKEILLKLSDGKKIKAAFITSVYVLFLNSFVMFGLIWAVTNIMFSWVLFFPFPYGIISIFVLLKWMEWSTIWSMAIVFSVLEERMGVEAFWISGYFSRGNKQRGLYLVLVFFAWRAGIRLAWLYAGGNENWGALVVTALLSCVGNVMKWVVCTVYFYDCKNRVLEKKGDVEEGSEANIASS